MISDWASAHPQTPHHFAPSMPPDLRLNRKAPQLDALTGLRFLAAAAVFLSHIKVWFVIDNFDPGPIGSAAVGFFFVLSGFILSHVYRGAQEHTPPGRFYLARLARIWPMHIVCLALLCVTPGFRSAPDTLMEWSTYIEHALLLQSWTLDTSAAMGWNGPAWSLSVEAFFYVMFPFLVTLSGRTLAILAIASTVSVLILCGIADRSALADPASAPAWKALLGVVPLFRLPEFLVGICTHVAWLRCRTEQPRHALLATAAELGSIALIVLLFLTWGTSQWGTAWAWCPERPVSVESLSRGPGMSIGFAALIAAFASGRGLLGRLCAHKYMVYLGEVSFAFYMAHSLVLGFASQGARDLPDVWHRPLLAGTLMTLGASACLFAFIENPVRRALLARNAKLISRSRIATATAAKEVRRTGFLIATTLGLAGLAIACLMPIRSRERCTTVIQASKEHLRACAIAPSCTLLGAVPHAHSDRFECSAALEGRLPEGAELRFLAVRNDGIALHRLAHSTESLNDGGEPACSLVLATSPLPPLAGASILQLRVCAITDPTHQPYPGTTPVEIFRLPW